MDFLILFEISVAGVVKPSRAQAIVFRPSSFETPTEFAILALDVLRTIWILVIVSAIGYQKSCEVYRKKCKSVSQELIRLSVAVLMFVFTLMDVVESYRLIMPTHELYKKTFKDTSQMAQSFKWSIYWEAFQLLIICMLPIRHLRISRRVNLFYAVIENVSESLGTCA